MTWHADGQLLTRYRSGAIDEAHAASVEAHLLRCDACRNVLAQGFGTDRLERIWEGVADAIDAPRQRALERVLVRLGVPDHVARLLGATRSLRLSWFLSVSIALGFAAGAARLDHQLEWFLFVAPLVPLAGVAAAFGPGVDPTYEIGLAASMRSFRLLLIRSVAVVATSTVLAGLAALALPRLGWMAAGWLLPSLAITAGGLALSSFWAPARAFGLVAFAWTAVIVPTVVISRVPVVAFRGGGQVAFAAVLFLAAVVVFRRRESFEQRRVA